MDERSFRKLDDKLYTVPDSIREDLSIRLNNMAKLIEGIKISNTQTAKIIQLLIKHADHYGQIGYIIDALGFNDFDIFINVSGLTQFQLTIRPTDNEEVLPYDNHESIIYYYADSSAHDLESTTLKYLMKEFEDNYNWMIAVYDSIKKLHELLGKYSFNDIERMTHEQAKKNIWDKAELKPDPM